MAFQTHRPRYAISLYDLGAHIEGALFEAIHDRDLSDAEKVVVLRALAGLARSLSGHWAHQSPAYGTFTERVWNRLSGLSPDGEVPAGLLQRITEEATDD